MDDIERLRTLTGEKDENVLRLLLEDAEAFVLSYTNRKNMIGPLRGTVRELAKMAYNRMGTEGENSRRAAGESYDFDNAPKSVYVILNRYRLARVGGKVHEAKKEST